MNKTIVAAALGECVHVAGVNNFLRLAEQAGWRTIYLGPATSIATVLEVARHEQADLVGVSYRLTPTTGERLLAAFTEEADELRNRGVRFAFAGTPPLAKIARQMGFFEMVYEGGEPEDTVLAYLKDQPMQERNETDFPQTMAGRIDWKKPYPLIRHHFGLPTLQETITGIEQIADAQVLDVISLGIDQDAQQNFFHTERQSVQRKGAGGVPVRSPKEYSLLHEASRRGNFPLLRTYSGTDDFIRLAEMYLETINIAWCAIPLFWFNKMDGRGPWDLESSIRQHQLVMQWYAERGIPVELNEPHHWGMRDASDVTFVVSAYLSAYNARAFGVQDYIAQMMFNSPPGVSEAMDLAKMLAILEIIAPMCGTNFRLWRQTRGGLLSYPGDIDAARGHLAASVYLQMALKPHIVHVVGHTEATHAATAQDVIEACKIARRAIENALHGQPDMTADKLVQQRKNELLNEAQITIEAIKSLPVANDGDPLTNPSLLASAVTSGILDAPQLRNNPYAQGITRTHIDRRGACVSIDPLTGKPINEIERLAQSGISSKHA